jgi:hypothetical protein
MVELEDILTGGRFSPPQWFLISPDTLRCRKKNEKPYINDKSEYQL